MSCAMASRCSGLATARSSVPGAALLHLHRLQRHVERAEFHQALGGVGQHLRIEVVDIGFDDADGERFVGAGKFAQDDAQHVGVIGELVVARAIAHRRDLHGRQHAEAGQPA